MYNITVFSMLFLSVLLASVHGNYIHTKYTIHGNLTVIYAYGYSSSPSRSSRPVVSTFAGRICVCCTGGPSYTWATDRRDISHIDSIPLKQLKSIFYTDRNRHI